ncbi:MAG: hypothetical protein WD825_00155 [Gemmatimonadaceae bacterium]
MLKPPLSLRQLHVDVFESVDRSTFLTGVKRDKAEIPKHSEKNEKTAGVIGL